VTLAVSFASGISIRESWTRLIGGAFVYDVFSSTLGLLLAYLYVRLEFAGLAVLLLPLFFVRHIYR
jgi:hypothetical protein